MFMIKRGTEYFRSIKAHIFQDELFHTVSWVTDKSKAASFTTFEAAEETLKALGYSDSFITSI